MVPEVTGTLGRDRGLLHLCPGTSAGHSQALVGCRTAGAGRVEAELGPCSLPLL